MTLMKTIRYALGFYHPEREVHEIKNTIARETLKTEMKARRVNKLLYNKDTTYFLAKAMGVKL